jgi:hypothetical protein
VTSTFDLRISLTASAGKSFAAVLCKGGHERALVGIRALANATAVIDGNAVVATAGIGLAANERVPVDLTDPFAQAHTAALSRQRTRNRIEVGKSMSRRPKGPGFQRGLVLKSLASKRLARRGQLVASNAA